MIIAVDFDGTIVKHEYPKVGAAVPGAIEWLKKFMEAGAKLILWTMRDDGDENGLDKKGRPRGQVLTEAVQFCQDNGLSFFGINYNPEQHWSNSNKAYAHIYIDDAAFGCPLKDNSGGKPYVDWDIVGPEVLKQILEDA